MLLIRAVQNIGIAAPPSVRSKSILSSLRSSRVLISSSDDIYTNLAIEHWLYTNLKFSTRAKQADFDSPVVFLWVNSPCVVIGKHQNPWQESTLGFVERAGIKLARRFSGGGCVYHDENNINISVIGNREIFSRRQDNLRLLSKFLKDKYAIECEPSLRHDLKHVETGLKMSGSAARLGSQNSYHHFTLLVDSDKEVLSTAIRRKDQDFIHSNSTSSVRSDVINLSELKNGISTETVLNDLAQEYGKIYRVPIVGKNDIEFAEASCREDSESIASIINKLKDWEWIYGQTPQFKLERSITVSEKGVDKEVKFIVQINKGRFEKFIIEGETIKDNPAEKFNHLIGVKFNYKESVPVIAKMFNSNNEIPHSSTESIGSERVFATLLLQMIHGANY